MAQRSMGFEGRLGSAAGSTDLDIFEEVDAPEAEIQDTGSDEQAAESLPESLAGEQTRIDWSQVMPELRPETPDALESAEVPLLDPLLQMEKIIDADNRRPVGCEMAQSFPYHAICHLRIELPVAGRVLNGTGWLAGPRLVVTAGHCVFRRELNRFASRIVVSPGRCDAAHSITPQTVLPAGGRFRTNTYYRNAGRSNGGKPEFDYGAILLPQPFDQLKQFGYANLEASRLKEGTFNVVGYPVDKPVGTLWGHGLALYRVDKRKLIYKIDTEGGQSGAPLWQLVKQDGKTHFVVVGVHNSHSTTSPVNYAARIESSLFRLIEHWRQLSES